VGELSEIFGLEEAVHKLLVCGLFEAGESLLGLSPRLAYARLGFLTCSLFEAFQLARTYP